MISGNQLSNPVSGSASDVITEKQSTAYNVLLTQVAKSIVTLQQTVERNYNIDKTLNAIVSWQYLLNDLLTVVLPEFYVVFQDKTTTAPQRRRLYDITQAIYYALVNYNQPLFLQKLALCLPKEPATFLDSIKSFSKTFSVNSATGDNTSSLGLENKSAPDSYVTGTGKNAEMAYHLKKIADFVEVKGFYYLEKFDPYYQLLLNEKNLLESFENKTLQQLHHQLQWWQQERLQAFGTVQEAQVLIFKGQTQHALAHWMLTGDFEESSSKSGLQNTLNTKPFELTVGSNPHSKLMTNSVNLKNGIGAVVMNVVAYTIFSSSFLSIVILGIVYLVTLLYGSYSISDAFNYKQHATTLKNKSETLAFISIIAMFFGGVITAFAINGLAVSFWMWLLATNQSKIDNRLAHNKQEPPLKPSVESFEKIKQEAVDVEASVINYELPLDINRHSYHLALLLSNEPTSHLKQLIESANKLYTNLDYLQQTYPYLATRVDEFLKDLTHNTLVRLDELASQFVNDDRADKEAQALFIEQHESRIDDLLKLNLHQVNELNKTILEKQMAEFSQIGQQTERQFRNSVMELKILLRWLIAQQPDETQASSHEVILERLEATTLTDMQHVFFNSSTTSEQRAALQNQIDKLLNHFKNQSTEHLYQSSSDANNAEILNLLQLSNSQMSLQVSKEVSHNRIDDEPLNDNPQHDDIVGGKIDGDRLNNQLKNQDFIEFNKHYINEILSHWH